MDRTFYLSPSTFHRYCVGATVLCLVVAASVTTANAQGRRGGFGFGGDSGGDGGGDFLQRMDRNENGRLDEDEIPEGMRGILETQGVDISEGVSFEDFGGARESMRVQFQNGGGGRGFSFNIGGGEGDDDEGGGWSGRGGRDGDSRRSRDSDDDDDDDDKEARPRVTFDLPASHSAADTDGDGQLGMYEWRRWSGHSLREFLEMDGNGDGFVTPREVYVVIGFPDADSTPTRSVASVPSGSAPRTSETTTPTSTTATPVGSGGNALTAEANRYFGILDKDDDGALSTEEWGSSIRIRGMFEEGGVDLSQPMPSDAFVEHYVRLSNQAG